jgi:beta-lactamase superfamily II metal-dependent hydrolase
MYFSDAPSDDEVEVSIFGPGRGESCLIHLGKSEWIVIDSCKSRPDGHVPVLSYLDGLGVDIQRAVRLVVATHAHDDHIEGISSIFERAEAAFFVLPVAMSPEEFAALVVTDRAASLGLGSLRRAHKEYAKIASILASRPSPVPGVKAVIFAGQGRTLLDSANWAVTSLSPSDEANQRALQSLASRLAVQGDRIYPTSRDPNELACALWIEAGEKRLLFGGDLLAGPPNCGWSAVVASFRPTRPASIFKIPHHGSPGAHHEDVWSNLVSDDSIALLTPFRGGRRPLPSPTDVERIASLASAVYASAPTRPGEVMDVELRRAVSAVGALGHNVRRLGGPCGQVRARSRFGEEGWRVEVLDPALSHKVAS